MTGIPLDITALADRLEISFAEIGPDPKAQTALLRKSIEEADIFFGVLPDGYPWLIKGDALLGRIASGILGDVHTAIAAIRVRNAEEAEAMRQVFGEASPTRRSTSRHRLHAVKGADQR